MKIVRTIYKTFYSKYHRAWFGYRLDKTNGSTHYGARTRPCRDDSTAMEEAKRLRGKRR